MLTDTSSTLHHLVEVKVISRGLTLFDVNKMNISTISITKAPIASVMQHR